MNNKLSDYKLSDIIYIIYHLSIFNENKYIIFKFVLKSFITL